MTDSDVTIQSLIDSDFLDEAEREIHDILEKQQIAFRDHWNSGFFVKKVSPFLRLTVLVLSLFGFVFCLFSLFVMPFLFSGFNAGYDAFAFLILAIISYYLNEIADIINIWIEGYRVKSCKKLAGACVKEARKQVPYTAEYRIRDSSITYTRVKDNDPKQAWTRKARGVAIHGRFATVLFRKWTAFTPRMVILHDDFRPIQAVLNSAGIDSRMLVQPT